MDSAALAQRIYIGSTPANSQYPDSRGLDSNGRATDVDARPVDQYSGYSRDYGRLAPTYGVPGHYHGAGYVSGGTYPGSYSGLGYTDSLGYSVGLSGYSGGYLPSNTISPPRTIIVGGVYPSRTVINNATRGGVMESTHNGNGYVYTAGSSYPTVVSSGPSIFPSVSVIQPSQPPVVIEAKKISSNPIGGSQTPQPGKIGGPGEIKLMYPQSASSSLSYMLNGTVYSIKPGYIQTFANDRVWTIEFLRNGNQSQVMRYQLSAGTFVFDADQNGWDLKQAPMATVVSPPAPPPLPPPPAPAPVPASDL